MDAQDRLLRELLSHPPLADDGFSERVVRRIRRRAILARWLLPAAWTTGALVAAGPALALLGRLTATLASVPDWLPGPLSASVTPALGALLSGLVSAAAVAFAVRLLED